MARVRLEDVHKTYPNGHHAVKGIDLDIADGELLVLVGPSGCGKSTALRMIAGLESPTRGRIVIGDRDVTDVRVQDRDVAMVFQSYALYPHRTVRRNLSFALELRRRPMDEIERRIGDVARTLGLEGLLDRKPAQLSGGERQRVALGRAIVRNPQVFLFDEPLSNLDATLRVAMRAELSRLHRRLGATMIHVTHDQEEAMTLGDRIAVLNGGRVEQCAPPLEVYRTPASVFVAGFVGSPAMNFLEPSVAGAARRGDVICGIRPEHVEIVEPTRGDPAGRIDMVERLGADVVVHVRLDAIAAAGPDEARTDRNVRVLTDADVALAEGDAVGLRFAPDHVHYFDRASGARVP